MKRLLVVLAACSAPTDRTPRIDGVTPDYGPLVGGTRITITGTGFTDDDPQPTRVFVGGREAPLAHAVDDTTLDVIIPPGDAPGPAELLVLGGNGNAIAPDRFRYSSEPAIAAVAPAEVIYAQPTVVTITGSGFADEGAGTPTVLVDGIPVDEIEIVSDSELRFTAPAGRALGRPRIELANTRGVATKERAFRYRPAPTSGLLLFPRSSALFAVFFDPGTRTRVDIPRTASSLFISTAIVDEHGEYWAVENSSRIGRIDFNSQQLAQTAQLVFRFPAIARRGESIYAIDRWSSQFGTVTLDGTFTPIRSSLPCCGSYGLAADGATLYFAYRSGIDKYITTIDPATGALGTPVELVGNAGLHIEELRAFRGTLYGASRDGTLLQIDPATGETTVVLSLPRANAMEVFE